MVAAARKSRSDGVIEVSSTAVADVVKVLARHNPGLSQTALAATSRVMAAVSAVAARLPPEQQRRIATDDKKLAQAIETAVAELAGKRRGELVELRIETPEEVSTGSGVGELVDIEEGKRRLTEYATSARLEDWAGPVAGPSEIEKRFGTKRSTLHDWQKRGAIIGLLKGERKHVFPLAQFVDGRPVEGMPQVTKIIRNPRVAWQWLIQPKPSIGGTPLDRLKKGCVDEVLAVAHRDFG